MERTEQTQRIVCGSVQILAKGALFFLQGFANVNTGSAWVFIFLSLRNVNRELTFTVV